MALLLGLEMSMAFGAILFLLMFRVLKDRYE